LNQYLLKKAKEITRGKISPLTEEPGGEREEEHEDIEKATNVLSEGKKQGTK